MGHFIDRNRGSDYTGSYGHYGDSDDNSDCDFNYGD
jgi:hypothetical protein